MPRNVRNFFLTVKVDDRNTEVRTGPQGKDGGMSFSLKQRNKGEIIPVLDVTCYRDVVTGKLRTVVFGPKGERIGDIIETDR